MKRGELQPCGEVSCGLRKKRARTAASARLEAGAPGSLPYNQDRRSCGLLLPCEADVTERVRSHSEASCSSGTLDLAPAAIAGRAAAAVARLADRAGQTPVQWKQPQQAGKSDSGSNRVFKEEVADTGTQPAPVLPCCSGFCARSADLEQQLDDQRRMLETLHSKNVLLAVMNSNLLAQLNAVSHLLQNPQFMLPASSVSLANHEPCSSSICQPQQLQPASVPSEASLHLKIALPVSMAQIGDDSPASEKAEGAGGKAGPPMLHIWVHQQMPIGAISQSINSFVATPEGHGWLLSSEEDGLPLKASDSPRSLNLQPGAMLHASLTT